MRRTVWRVAEEGGGGGSAIAVGMGMPGTPSRAGTWAEMGAVEAAGGVVETGVTGGVAES